MSTVKAINFQHPSASAANITLASDGTVSGGIPSPNRNLLYNGAMQVAQRGTSTASITAGGYYTADRWSFEPTTFGTWTNSIESDAPSGSGLSKSFKLLCTTADAAPAAGDSILFGQRLEGQDLQRIAKGTASAQQLTLSFWVKSNVTGTYVCNLYDNDNTRSVSATYTISASATWEKKSITFPADTTGAFDNDNALSLYVFWWLGAGSTFTSGTLNTTWTSATSANRAVGQTNLAAATNNYWQVTGVQLEVGSQATAFEFKSFGQELRECQRYYYRIFPGTTQRLLGYAFNITTTLALGFASFPVTMRIGPTALEQNGTASHYQVAHQTLSTNGSTVPSFNTLTTAEVGGFMLGVASGLTAGEGSLIRSNDASAYVAWSAEL